MHAHSFTVIGGGALAEPLAALATRLGVRALFDFTGTAYEDLPARLRGLDVLVNPSLRADSETFCIANVEVRRRLVLAAAAARCGDGAAVWRMQAACVLVWSAVWAAETARAVRGLRIACVSSLVAVA
jgi:glycosyltransferase involved in cell wall biosynthesis